MLHGLWPEYEKGYPSDCSTARLPENLKTRSSVCTPTRGLFDHEWGKHGTCSGLSPDNYLALSKSLKDSIRIPSRYQSPPQPVRVTSAQLKQDLVADNSGLVTAPWQHSARGQDDIFRNCMSVSRLMGVRALAVQRSRTALRAVARALIS